MPYSVLRYFLDRVNLHKESAAKEEATTKATSVATKTATASTITTCAKSAATTAVALRKDNEELLDK